MKNKAQVLTVVILIFGFATVSFSAEENLNDLKQRLSLINAEREVVEAEIALESRKQFLADLKKNRDKPTVPAQATVMSIASAAGPSATPASSELTPALTGEIHGKPNDDNAESVLSKRREEQAGRITSQKSDSKKESPLGDNNLSGNTETKRLLAVQTPERIDDANKISPAVENAANSAPESNASVGAVSVSTHSDRLRSFFHVGVRSVSAYSLTKGTNAAGATTYTLGNKASETPAFFEYVYWNTLVGNGQVSRDPKSFKEFWKENHWDGQVRFGYTYRDDKDISAAAVVGSGDFNAEVTLSKLFYAVPKPLSTFGLDLSYGLVTDTSSIKAHHRGFIGPSITAEIPGASPGSPTGIFNMRVGVAGIDAVHYIDPVGNEIISRRGRPSYNWHRFGAVEVEALYPLGADALVTLGARIYSAQQDKDIPSSWTLYLGYSKPVGKVFSGLKNFLPSEDATTTSKKSN